MASLQRISRMARMCMDVYEDGCPIPNGTFMPLMKTVRILQILPMPLRFETERQKYEFLRELVARAAQVRTGAMDRLYDV